MISAEATGVKNSWRCSENILKCGFGPISAGAERKRNGYDDWKKKKKKGKVRNNQNKEDFSEKFLLI